MTSSLPPDPYIALGVSKDATAAEIKSAHRKLVLKWHPDKVSDEAAKQTASDEFHKIQTSYEILSNEERRGRYDAQVRLNDLRKDAAARQATSGGSREARGNPVSSRSYQDPPSRSNYQTSSSRDWERSPPRFEERRPSYASPVSEQFDQVPKASVRKEQDYPRTTRRATVDSGRDRLRPSERESAREAERADRKDRSRRSDRDLRRERDSKNRYYSEESETDSDGSLRLRPRARDVDDQRRPKESEFERPYRPRQDSSYEDYFAAGAQRMYSQDKNAKDYIRSSNARSKPEPERRPSPTRMSSTRSRPAEVVRPSPGRMGSVRRPSERHESDYPRRSSTRDYMSARPLSPERVTEMRKAPNLPTARSSPADIRIPSDRPRAQSVQYDADEPPVPSVRRADTMPQQRSNRYPENYQSSSKAAYQRHRESNDSLPTPGTSPEYDGGYFASSKAPYLTRAYADDLNQPLQDRVRTELREPLSKSSSSRPGLHVRTPSSPNTSPPPRRDRVRDRAPDREREYTGRSPRDYQPTSASEKRPSAGPVRYSSTSAAAGINSNTSLPGPPPGLPPQARSTSYYRYTPGAAGGVQPYDVPRSMPSKGGPIFAEPNYNDDSRVFASTRRGINTQA